MGFIDWLVVRLGSRVKADGCAQLETATPWVETDGLVHRKPHELGPPAQMPAQASSDIEGQLARRRVNRFCDEIFGDRPN